MKIIQMHQTITTHDAIGNDIAAINAILQEHGECFAYAENRLDPALRYIGDSELADFLSDPDNLLIYHHSGFWRLGELALQEAAAHIVVRYHNVTPPAFFEPGSFQERQCRLGREQTIRLAALPNACWLSASAYNCLDIPAVPQARRAVCAPFNKLGSWAAGMPDEAVLQKLLFSRAVNLLFVGRVAPNKGHLLLLDVLKTYCQSYDKDIHLWVIGKFDDDQSAYAARVRERIAAYGLADNIHFIGEINDAIMSAYYLGCDFYLCASEHEGFGVPLVEAQYFGLPVLARASSAVPETLGPNQMILGEDPRMYAAAIRQLYHDRAALRWLRENGWQNYQDRFTYAKLRQCFLAAMRQWGFL